MAENTYFIKNGYITNPVQTFSEDPLQYWTEHRIETSKNFQYHVYEYASKLAKEKNCRSILDIGAGPGTKLAHFFNKLDIKLALIDQPGMESIVKKVCPKAQYWGANIENPEFSTKDNYDMVICSDVIEHLENPDSLLTIIQKHMHDDSILILSTPDRDMRRGVHNIQSPNKAHVREWNQEELGKYISSKGFQILKHINLPAKKLSTTQYWISQKLTYRMLNKTNWFACQCIIAQKDLKRP